MKQEIVGVPGGGQLASDVEDLQENFQNFQVVKKMFRQADLICLGYVHIQK